MNEATLRDGIFEIVCVGRHKRGGPACQATCGVQVNGIMRIIREAALATSAPQEYPHLVICSGDRRYPAGVPGHSCCCLNIAMQDQIRWQRAQAAQVAGTVSELRLVQPDEMISWLTDLNSNWAVCRNTRAFKEGQPSEYWKKFDAAMGEAFELQIALMKLRQPPSAPAKETATAEWTDKHCILHQHPLSENKKFHQSSDGKYLGECALHSQYQRPTPVVQPDAQGMERAPDGYAYRYPAMSLDGKDCNVIRFETGGREINGTRPIEAVPYFYKSSVDTLVTSECNAARLAEHKRTCTVRVGNCSRCIELGDEASLKVANEAIRALAAKEQP